MKSLLAAIGCAALLIPAAAQAQLFKDSGARDDLETLRTRLNNVESTLQVRQMGLGEQIKTFREELARVEAKFDENRRSTEMLGQQLDVSKIETQEALVKLNLDYQQRFQVLDDNSARLLKGIENLQQNIRTLSDNIQTMSEFEQKQEERIGEIQNHFREQISVVVEEVTQENLRLRNENAQIRGDLASFADAINTLDSRVRGLGSRLDAVSRRQESMSRAASTSSAGEHIVEKGETLSSIAQRYGVTVQGVMSANGMSNPDLIRVGQALTIP